MDTRTQIIAEDFKRAMQLLYGARLNRVVLFGSYARGEQSTDSDIDFMVVLNDESISRLAEINRFLETQSDLSLKHDVTVSILPVALPKYAQSVQPVYQFARSEGVVL